MFGFNLITLPELQNLDDQQADSLGLLTSDEFALLEKVEFDAWWMALDTDMVRGEV